MIEHCVKTRKSWDKVELDVNDNRGDLSLGEYLEIAIDEGAFSDMFRACDEYQTMSIDIGGIPSFERIALLL